MQTGLVMVLKRIRDGDIGLQVVATGGDATPVARVGIERVSMKTDLIPPEKMRAVLVAAAKARLLNEIRQFCLHELLGLHGNNSNQRFA